MYLLRLIWIQLQPFLTTILSILRLWEDFIIIRSLCASLIYNCFRAFIFFVNDTWQLLSVIDLLILSLLVSAFLTSVIAFNSGFSSNWASSELNHFLTGVIICFRPCTSLPATDIFDVRFILQQPYRGAKQKFYGMQSAVQTMHLGIHSRREAWVHFRCITAVRLVKFQQYDFGSTESKGPWNVSLFLVF